MSNPATPATPPADRYGTPRRRASLPVLAAVGLLVAAFLAWVVWAGLGAAEPDVGADVTAFTVRSDRLIEVTVAPAPGAPGRFGCSISALDRTKGVVGVASVQLDGETQGFAAKQLDIRTRARAVTAVVGQCQPLR